MSGHGAWRAGSRTVGIDRSVGAWSPTGRPYCQDTVTLDPYGGPPYNRLDDPDGWTDAEIATEVKALLDVGADLSYLNDAPDDPTTDDTDHLLIRTVMGDDPPFLNEMLYEAAYWRADSPRPRLADVLADPVLSRYTADWWRPGDSGVVAEEDGRRIGAAWYRLFPADAPGYGFVDDHTPELSIAVVADRRGAGVGGALLAAAIEQADAEGFERMSLSVEPDNPAIELYKRHGFEVVGQNGGSVTMRVGLTP